MSYPNVASLTCPNVFANFCKFLTYVFSIETLEEGRPLVEYQYNMI